MHLDLRNGLPLRDERARVAIDKDILRQGLRDGHLELLAGPLSGDVLLILIQTDEDPHRAVAWESRPKPSPTARALTERSTRAAHPRLRRE
eukprot:2694433-Pyramimonas_sp.AAC.1